ncbi:MAG: methionyl-tRNA formyltransferase [Planctomycetes bacterium]|nr:methionyl-tRNA formyltransferase [Planctomycetota bacterium]
MNVALIGSVSSSFTALQALIRAGVDITAVLGLEESQADRVADYRSLRSLAEGAALPFLSFGKVTEPAVGKFLRNRQPDMLWCIGLSQLLPEQLIRIARHGGVGFHPTMLPKGRGRAPVAWTILRGERAAVNLFYLADEPDAGDIIVQREVPVLPDDYSQDLIQRTNEMLHEVILELAPAIKSDTLPRTPQDHSQATYYPKRTPADGLIDWSKSADDVYRLIRAAGRPYPGTFTYLGETKVTIWRARPEEPTQVVSDRYNKDAGTILTVDAAGRPLVKTGDGAIRLTESEPDDAVISAATFLVQGRSFQDRRSSEESPE